MPNQITEKIKRLLNTRKKRVAAAVVSVSVLIVAAVLLYYILRSKGKTRKAVSKEQAGVFEASSRSREGETRSNQNNAVRPIQSKHIKRLACEEVLAALGKSVEAQADQATLEGLLLQVEELCPEDELHNARVSFRNADMSTEEGVRTALSDALERPILDMAELESHFQKVNELNPVEPSQTLSEYAVKLYEDIKSKEAETTLKKEEKKLRRLLRTVNRLTPDYIDDPPLHEIIGSGNVVEFELTADVVSDAEAQEIIRSETPSLFTPQPERRINLTRKMQEALDKRNNELKELCELGKSLPRELQDEFIAWKSIGFKTINSPEFVTFMDKAKNSNDKSVLSCLQYSSIYHFAEGEYLLNSHKHRIDRDDAYYGHENQAWLAQLMVGFKTTLPISDIIIDWLKGEDWDQIYRLVEHLLNCHPLVEYFPDVFLEADGTGYYRATMLLFDARLNRKNIEIFKIAHSPDLLGYWSAVENAWRNGNGDRAYEWIVYYESKNLRDFEELENKFKGTDNHKYKDEHESIYEPVHVKLNVMEFLKKYESTESEEVNRKAIVLGVDPENLKESQLSLFEGCPKIYNLLIIKMFASKVNEIPLKQIAKMLKEQNEEFRMITLELASFKECSKLATKVREDLCSISSEGIITCTTPRWNERVNDPKWLGWILFKPTVPYEPTYLRDLLSREQNLRKQYNQRKLIHMFINDIEADSSVHPGRPTKRMHLSSKVIDFDRPKFNQKWFARTRYI